jgi:16S rRNA (adenine1518-N6/adenine1519-N6)-dimethyltransferase
VARPPGGDVFARPKRALGQNFLVDRNLAAKIVSALCIGPGDTVVEIGPGRGALCPHVLAASPARYLCLELDSDLARALGREHPGLSVANLDALRCDWTRAGGALILGNLPYNVASPLIWDICAAGAYSRAVFMVQREAAQRLAAPPGSKVYGALSAWVGAFARAEYLFTVGPNVFRPRPKVDSAVIRLTPRPDRPGAEEAAGLSQLIKTCFQQRRKQLQKILRPHLGEPGLRALAELGLSAASRPEQMGPDGFRRLLKNISGPGFPLTFT